MDKTYTSLRMMPINKIEFLHDQMIQPVKDQKIKKNPKKWN